MLKIPSRPESTTPAQTPTITPSWRNPTERRAPWDAVQHQLSRRVETTIEDLPSRTTREIDSPGDLCSRMGSMQNNDERPTSADSDSNDRGDVGSEPLAPAPPETPSDAPEVESHPQHRELQHTRTAGTWAAVVIATVTLIVLLVFILQNLQPTTVTFLGITGNLPVGVALLLAAAIGGLLVAFVGAARILQLRRTAHRHRKQNGPATQ